MQVSCPAERETQHKQQIERHVVENFSPILWFQCKGHQMKNMSVNKRYDCAFSGHFCAICFKTFVLHTNILSKIESLVFKCVVWVSSAVLCGTADVLLLIRKQIFSGFVLQRKQTTVGVVMLLKMKRKWSQNVITWEMDFLISFFTHSSHLFVRHYTRLHYSLHKICFGNTFSLWFL